MAEKSGLLVSLTVAGVGILGALLGGAAQHFFTVVEEHSKAFEARQAEAYVALGEAFDKPRMSRQQGEETNSSVDPALKTWHAQKAAELNLQYELEGGAAVRRITVYGDKRVLQALAEVYRAQGGNKPCNEAEKPELSKEVSLWQSMRDVSVGKGQDVSADDIAVVALRCSLS